MPHRFDDGAGVTPDGATVIVAYGRDSLSVPGDFDLLHGDFSRDGGDLVVGAPDGARLTVADYFDSESPPDLVTANGATLSADLVTRLAGPMAPGQYAQLATDAGGAEAIGTRQSLPKTTAITTSTPATSMTVDLEPISPTSTKPVMKTPNMAPKVEMA